MSQRGLGIHRRSISTSPIHSRNKRQRYTRTASTIKSNESFEDIVTKAISLEVSKMESQELTKRQATSLKIANNSEETNKIVHRQQTPRRDRSRPHRTSRNTQLARNKSKSRIDYRQLGIEGFCLRCGRSNHNSKECKIDRTKLKCSSCDKIGHIAKVCISTLLIDKGKNNQPESSAKQMEESHSDYGIGHLETNNQEIIDIYDQLNETVKDAVKYFVSVQINGKSQTFEVDSGAGYTLIPKDFNQLNLSIKLSPPKIVFDRIQRIQFNLWKLPQYL